MRKVIDKILAKFGYFPKTFNVNGVLVDERSFLSHTFSATEKTYKYSHSNYNNVFQEHKLEAAILDKIFDDIAEHVEFTSTNHFPFETTGTITILIPAKQ